MKKRTTLNLDDSVLEQLREFAFRARVSMSQLVEEAIVFLIRERSKKGGGE